MGYYVRITDSTAHIPAQHLDEAYRRMCALNTTHDHLKQGGSWRDGVMAEKWFSWMDANYPETCKDAADIIGALGFEFHLDDIDGIVIDGYDSKTGQEELFLSSIADLMVGFIEWMGEDTAQWRWEFGPTGMKRLRAAIAWEEEN